MRRVKWNVISIALGLLVMPFTICADTVNAVSDYDNLLQVSPTLYVYTDGNVKSKKMDISTTWWAEFKQTYAKRVAQNIGWPTNFVTEFEDIMASGGSWGVYATETSAGRLVTIVGTHDPNATCGFTGSAASGLYECKSNPGYGFVRALYFTHESYGNNGCIGHYVNRCSDTGMNIYNAPTVNPGTNGYTFVSISNVGLSNYDFFFMNFDLQYPSGYNGTLIPTTPPPAKYVAMGDSFSSGEGNPPFEAGTAEANTNECHRSPRAYPRLLQDELELGSTMVVACSGAMTENVRNGGQWNEAAQVTALTSETDTVTLTIGGNDVGFKDFAIACTVSLCDFSTQAYQDIYDSILNDLPSKLASTYQAIDNETVSDAKIYVLGYPHLAPPEMPTGSSSMCWPFNGGANNPDPALNNGAAVYAIQTQLNNTIQQAVADYDSTKFQYIDPNGSTSPFVGHDWCKQDRYFTQVAINQLSYSYHPNTQGHMAYASVFMNALP